MHSSTSKRRRFVTDTDLTDRIHSMLPQTGHVHKCSQYVRKCLVDAVYFIVDKDNAPTILPDIALLVREVFGPDTGMLSQGFTAVNNKIRTKFGRGSNEHVLSKHHNKLMEREKRRRMDSSNVQRYNRNIEQKSVNGKDILHMLRRLFTSEDTFDKIILLAVTSGNRLIELCSRSYFGSVGPSGSIINVSNLAKQADRRVVNKPLIFITPDEFMERLHSIRIELLGFADDTSLKNHVVGRVNKRVRKWLGEHVRFHDLRAIYGLISWWAFSRNESLAGWLSMVLGHARHNLTSSLSYSTIKIEDPEVLFVL